jgi:nicotinamidase/pyrazinamidase
VADYHAYSPRKGDALIIIDVQNDFLPGGSLAVPKGEDVVPILNQYLALFRVAALPVFATRDWHPVNHCSFVEQGGPWPPHCVAGTTGAAFARELLLPAAVPIISKAASPEKEAYSDFEDTDLDKRLRDLGVNRLFVGGLATDYCVLNTVLDGLRSGYTVFLLLDAIRAVDVQPGDGDRAIEEMKRHGAVPLTYSMVAGPAV